LTQLGHGFAQKHPAKMPQLDRGNLCDLAPARGAPFLESATTTKNDGTNSTVRQVEASILVNTVMPIDLRPLAPPPVAYTSGSMPRMKANQVIRTGRKETCAVLVTARF
jgi:hypothetical protein